MTFKDGDTIVDIQTLQYGEDAVAPDITNPDKYHDFKGWDTETKHVTRDLVVNAQWDLIDFDWGNSIYGYEAANQNKKGYYKYVGEEKTVRIPHRINGQEMTSYYRMFYESDVEKVISDNRNVTNMRGMFEFSKARNLDLSHFDTSNVTNMRSMFEYSKATSLDLSNFNTSNVTNMGDMFGNSKANSLDLSHFDTRNVETMAAMFQGMSLDQLDLSGFTTDKLTHMGAGKTSFDDDGRASVSKGDSYGFGGMFEDANIGILELFDTANVQNMSKVFKGSTIGNLNEVLRGMDTRNANSMQAMFQNAKVRESILDLSSFDVNKLNSEGTKGMFYNIRDAQTLKVKDQKAKDLFDSSSGRYNGSYNKMSDTIIAN